MPTLTLNVFARLNLEAMIRSHRSEDHEEILMLVDLRDKLCYSDSERSTYVLELPGRAPEFKMEAVKRGTPVSMEFEKAELRKIAALLRPVKVTADDATNWYLDLRKQLLEAGAW